MSKNCEEPDEQSETEARSEDIAERSRGFKPLMRWAWISPLGRTCSGPSMRSRCVMRAPPGRQQSHPTLDETSFVRGRHRA